MFRFIKNYLGNLKGYGSCPNCGDCWSWKENGNIYYAEFSGVIICKECLSNPKTLNVQKIIKVLLKYGWNSADCTLVGIAIIDYKQKNL